MLFARRLVSKLVAGCIVFAGIARGPAAAQTAPATRPVLYLVGDSTVQVNTAGQQGWGTPFVAMFDAVKIDVQNRAIGGRSSRSFIREGRWANILTTLKPGDYVILQMGHNDGGPLSGDNRERGSIRGVGEESQEVTLTLGDNKDKKETVHTYGHYLRQYVSDAKAKGATIAICSPIPRCPRPADGDKPAEKVEVPAAPQGYPLWAKQVAEAERVPFIDLHRLIWQRWVDAKLTPEQIKAAYFCEQDYTHTSPAGAKFNAEAVAEALKSLDVPLKSALTATGK